ncbi:hypothetical protein Hanom_Chr05g00414931 [Helianthus anomalus]
MALTIKNPHKYLPIFEKTDKNTAFHSIIDVLTSSKYTSILTTNAPIHQDTLRHFWANAKIEEQKKEPYAITSKVGGTLVVITPTTISQTFGLNYLAGKTSFPKNDLHT